MRVFLGDTVVLTQTLTGSDGTPVDLTGATVAAVVPGGTDGDATIVDPPTDGAVSYTTTAQEAGTWQTRWIVTNGSVITTHLGPALRIVDPEAQWATVADVEAIIGDQDDAAVEQAIDTAMLLIFSWLCADVPDPVPWEFSAATALIASKLVAAPAATDPIAETIGDYSYRLAGPPSPSALRETVRHLLGPWLCGNAQSVRVWPDPSYAVLVEPEEYQPDAEGFLRS